MARSEFDEQTYQAEHRHRLNELGENSDTDGIDPSEVMRRTMRETIQLGNPFIQEGDPFIVMGNDGIQIRQLPGDEAPIEKLNDNIAGDVAPVTLWQSWKKDRIGTAIGGAIVAASLVGYGITRNPNLFYMTASGSGFKLLISSCRTIHHRAIFNSGYSQPTTSEKKQ